MKPREEYRNGDSGGGAAASDDSDSGGEEAGASEEELVLLDAEAPVRALAALNALRKSRQHYDVVLVARGEEVPAHRALLAAASPYLLRALAEAPGAAPAYRVPDVEPDALRAIVEYAYTGRLAARSAEHARRLYRAAWRLRVEPARAQLAERLLRRVSPADCLELRALPDLPAHHLHDLDDYIAHNFDAVCAAGALAALPLVRVELLRASSADGGAEAPLAVADAALAWLRDHRADLSVEELCARTHLVFVDGAGALRDCGELPEAHGDAPELHEYRRAAAEREQRAARAPRPAPRPLPGLELGERAARGDWAVLAARGADATSAGAGRVTRALLVLGGALAAARVQWCDVGDAHSTRIAVGGPLGGGGACEPAAGGARRAALPGGRCAHGTAALGARLVVCGGYDRARVLRTAAVYDPATNAWSALPELRTARARFPAARLGGALYALGGSDGHSELASVDVFEAGAWRGAAPLPLARSHAAAAAHEAAGSLYVAGGWAGGVSVRAVHRYEPAADRWEEAPPLLTGRSQCAGVLWEGALWVLGGCDAWRCLASTETLPLGEAGAAWRAGPALPTARRSVGGAAWRGLLVSAGGSDGAASLRRTDWLAAGEVAWRAGPAMRRARAALGLAELGDVLYAVGGFDGKEFLSCVECLYAPDGEWTTLCEPPPPRALPATAPAAPSPDAAPAPAKERATVERAVQ